MVGDRQPNANATRKYVISHVLVGVLCCLGCNRNPYANNPSWGAPYAANPYTAAPPPGVVLPGYGQPQMAELERRVQQLDVNNRQLTTQLAQSQQQMQVYRDRSDLIQKQLQDTTSQLQQERLAKQDLQGQARGLQASMAMRGGATLRPNTSGQPLTSMGPLSGGGPLPGPGQAQPGFPPSGPISGQAGGATPGFVPGAMGALQIPGAFVQADGTVLRIRVPADQLFAPGTPQLNANAYQVLDNVATAILKSFPRQRVAIEAHTDSGNAGGAYATPYQLATVQAQAITDQLVRRNTLPMQQLTVVAHGPNFPRGDNQSPAGRAENRRIEFVIYPEIF